MPLNPTILIVDDDSDDRLLIREAVHDYSALISVVEIPGGEELIRLINKFQAENTRPSVIILDINMPRMDGVETLAQIRARGLAADVPIFVLTTMRDKKRAMESLKYGVASVTTKPNSNEELVKIISDF